MAKRRGALRASDRRSRKLDAIGHAKAIGEIVAGPEEAGRPGALLDPAPVRNYAFRHGRRCRFGRGPFDYRLIATPNRERKAYAIPASDL